MFAAAALSVMVTACAQLPPVFGSRYVAAPSCSTAAAKIAFDFEGASQSRCVIKGEREFSIVISPEHAPPINPSAWYGFRYEARPGDNLVIHLDYLIGKHRYPPKLTSKQGSTLLAVSQANEGKTASFTLPAGKGRVSGQEVFDAARYDDLYDRLERSRHVKRFDIGQSHDGHRLTALQMGNPQAAHLVVLLGRAHPPEISGAVAMEAFLEEVASAYDQGEIDLERVQVLAVPLLNPDGVIRGHWRANLGGLDLNRDWGAFTQPETRAVMKWLESLPSTVRPVAMLDFHSTNRNLFYVQGATETNARQERFLADWLIQTKTGLVDYQFDVVRTDANPGSLTAKNWFHRTYDIPAYTYEVGDEADRQAIRGSARILARNFMAQIAKIDSPVHE